MTQELGDMDLIFSWQEQYLTHSAALLLSLQDQMLQISSAFDKTTEVYKNWLLGRVLLRPFRRFLFRYKNKRTYRISIAKRTDFAILKTE